MNPVLTIDPEFEAKCPPLIEDELSQLEENILEEGLVLMPLIVWNNTIVDGHNRYRIAQEHPGIEFRVHEKHFNSKYEALSWICKNQLGRRNLTPQQKKYLVGQRYKAEKQIHGGDRKSEQAKSSSQNGNLISPLKTCERIAEETNTSKNYVIRAEHFSDGIDAAEEVLPGIKNDLLLGKYKPKEADVAAIARASPEERREKAEQLRAIPEKKPKADQESPRSGTKRQQEAYSCGTRRLNTRFDCPDEKVPEADILDAVMETIQVYAQYAVSIDRLLIARQNQRQLDRKQAQRQLQSLQSKKAQLDKRLQDLYEQLVEGELSRESFASQKKSITARMEEISRTISELERKASSDDENDNALIEKFKSYAGITALTKEISNDLLKSVTVYPDGYMDIQLNLADEIKELMETLRRESCTA